MSEWLVRQVLKNKQMHLIEPTVSNQGRWVQKKRQREICEDEGEMKEHEVEGNMRLRARYKLLTVA